MSEPYASSPGQHDLGTLLKTMAPILRPQEYVFCSISPDGLSRISLTPIGLFQEDEGITAIITVEQALAANLPVEPRWRLITLSVHSDLQAVGFLAAIATALASARISVNAVSAYFHDHLFVPSAQAEMALQCLQELSERA